MNKASTEGVGIFAQHYPRVAALITARAGSQANAMTAAWHMPISYNPPLYTVAIAPKRFTYSLIAASHEFGVNFMPADQAEVVAAVGGTHGAEIDKFHAFQLSTDKPLKTEVPILRTSYAAYECKVIDDRVYGDHRLLIGEIVLRDLPLEQIRSKRIQVDYVIDANGMVTATATDLVSGRQNSVSVDYKKGIKAKDKPRAA
jgi:flavin reductase (DIM6/NTAB) family NADH-FMN oxidoreductase RutF